MSNPTIRAFPIFYNGRKIAEANDNNANVKPGRTAMFAAEGYAAHSKGAVMFSLTSKIIVPVSGISVKAIEDAIAQKDVEIGVPVAGKFIKSTAAITNLDMTSNTETGRCEGSITFEGGITLA